MADTFTFEELAEPQTQPPKDSFSFEELAGTPEIAAPTTPTLAPPTIAPPTPLPPGGLLSESARVVPPIGAAYRGGPPVKVAPLAETLQEPAEVFRETMTHPSPIPTPFEIKPDEHPAVALGKEVVNLAVGIPQFFTTSLGIGTAAAATVAPTVVATAFTVDMLKNLGQGIRETYENWDKMTTAQKVVALADIGGGGLMSLATGAAAIRGIRTRFGPKVEKPIGLPGFAGKPTVTETTPVVPPEQMPTTPTATGVRPAIRLVGGEVVVGDAGKTHPDIISENKLKAEDIDQRGFVDEAGRFLDREQAAQATGTPAEREAGRQHSTDLPEAKAPEVKRYESTDEAKPDSVTLEPGTVAPVKFVKLQEGYPSIGWYEAQRPFLAPDNGIYYPHADGKVLLSSGQLKQFGVEIPEAERAKFRAAGGQEAVPPSAAPLPTEPLPLKAPEPTPAPTGVDWNRAYAKEHEDLLDAQKRMEQAREDGDSAAERDARIERDDIFQRLDQFDSLSKTEGGPTKNYAVEALRNNPRLDFSDAVFEGEQLRIREISDKAYDDALDAGGSNAEARDAARKAERKAMGLPEPTPKPPETQPYSVFDKRTGSQFEVIGGDISSGKIDPDSIYTLVDYKGEAVSRPLTGMELLDTHAVGRSLSYPELYEVAKLDSPDAFKTDRVVWMGQIWNKTDFRTRAGVNEFRIEREGKAIWVTAKKLTQYKKQIQAIGSELEAKAKPAPPTPPAKAETAETPLSDAAGNPIVFYHSGPAGITDFKSREIGPHFGTEAQAMKRAIGRPVVNPFTGQKGQIYAAHLAIKNPLRVEDYTSLGTLKKSLPKEAQKARSWAEAKTILKRLGYDGLVYANKVEGLGDTYVPFESSQIRLIEGGAVSKAKPAPTPTAKEPWQMTRKELRDTLDAGLDIPGYGRVISDTMHRDEVRKAIAEGKPVPPEVLADYPDLKPAPTAMVQSKGRTLPPSTKQIPPNSAFIKVVDYNGRTRGYVIFPHDGTKEGILKASKDADAYANERFIWKDEFYNTNSQRGATDETGKLKWVVQPNTEEIFEVGTPQAAYSLGDINAFRKERAKRALEAKQRGDVDAANAAIMEQVNEVEGLAKQYEGFSAKAEQEYNDAVAKQKAGVSVKTLDDRFSTWKEYLQHLKGYVEWHAKTAREYRLEAEKWRSQLIKTAKPAPPSEVLPAAEKVEIPKKIFARVRGTTQTFPVESLDDAARKYSLMRVKSQAGATDLPPVDLLDENGKQFARISYNGKIWDMEGKLLYDPFAKQLTPVGPTTEKAEQKVQTEVSKVAQTEGQRSAKEIKSELVKRVEDEIDKAIIDSEVKLENRGEQLRFGEKVPYIDYLARTDRGGAFGEVDKLPNGKFKVSVKRIGGKQSYTRNFDNIEDAEWFIQAAAIDTSGFSKINIPGDGDFTIPRSGEPMLDMLKKVNALDTSSSKLTTVPRGAATASEVKTIEESAKKLYGDVTKAADVLESQSANESLMKDLGYDERQISMLRQAAENLREQTPLRLAEEDLKKAQQLYDDLKEIIDTSPERIAKLEAQEAELKKKSWSKRRKAEKKIPGYLNFAKQEFERAKKELGPASRVLEKAKEDLARWQTKPTPEAAGPAGPGMGAAIPKEFVPSGGTPTSIKNATVDRERRLRGLPPAMEPARRSFQTVWDEAMAKIDREPDWQDRLIAELRDRPRALTDLEDAALLHRQIDLQNEYAKTTRDLARAYDDQRTADVDELKVRTAGWSDKLLDLYNINKAVGTETGRGLAARRMMANEDFTLARMEIEKRAANGGRELTEVERLEIQRLQEKIATLQKAYDDFVSKTAESEVKRALDEAERQAKAQPVIPPHVRIISDKVKAYFDARAEKALKDLQGMTWSLGPEVLVKMTDLGASKILSGVAEITAWSAEMVKMLGERIKPHLQTIWDASQAAIDERFNKVVGVGPKAEKIKRQAKGADLTERITNVKQRIKARLDEQDLTAISPLVQKLARFLVEQGVRTRDELIDQVHATLKEYLPEATRRDAMDAISGYGQFKPLPKDAISLILRDLKGQMQQIAKLEDMASGVAPSKTGLERRIPTDEERRLIKQVEEAKRKGGYAVTDPANQLRTAMQAIQKRLTNEIADLEHQIATRQKIVRAKTPVVYDAETLKLKARRDEIKQQFDEIFKPPGLTDAQRLANWKKRTTNRIADLQQRLADRDFAKRPVRPPPELDPEGFALKAQLEKAKRDFQRGLLEDRLKARPWWSKAQDTFLRWYRGGILSSPVVFAKLTMAALIRGGLTPLEEAVGAGISLVSPKLAERAPREGFWNSRAEAKAIMAHLTKGPKDAWDVLTKGESDLDVLYGRGREGAIGEQQVRPFSWADIPGRTHGAFKASTKRAEFERSLEKRLTWEIRNGADASNPAVQLRAAVEAYKDGQRAIFLGDNRVVSAYQAALRRLEQPSKVTGQPTIGGKLGATAARTLIPIVRVPSNIVAEAFQFATGAVTGSARAARAFSKGIETLPPEQADLIMRELKKGSIGAAAMLVGFLLPQVWGGFYRAGERRKPGDVKASEARIPGVEPPKILGGPDIPQSLLHHPIFEVIQAGATVRRVADGPEGQNPLGLPIGVKAAAMGLIEETPFVREMLDTGKAFNINQQNAYFGELAKSIAEPQLLQWLAKQSDKDAAGQAIARKPKTFAEHLKMGIPGLRQEVPERPIPTGAYPNY